MRELNKPTYLTNKYSKALCQSCGGNLKLGDAIAYDGKAHHAKCHPWTFKDDIVGFIMRSDTYKGTGTPGKDLFEQLFLELDNLQRIYQSYKDAQT